MLVRLKKQGHLILVALLLISTLFSCKKDDKSATSTPSPQGPDLTTKVTASSVSGFVLNENNTAVEGATVQIGSKTATTNQFGFFEVKQVEVIKTAATITVSKAGYFKNIRTFESSEGGSGSTTIKLTP